MNSAVRLTRTGAWDYRAALLLAVAGMLLRRADGSSLVPVSLLLLMQLPAIGLWARRQWRGAAIPAARVAAGEIAILIIVAIASFVPVQQSGDWSHALSGPVLFLAGLDLGAYLVKLYRRLESEIADPARILVTIVQPWCGLILLGTLLLSLPIATRSGVPDYAHNFWLHAVTCAFTAASAACLVGNTIYSLGEDFTRFGNCVTLGIVELSGLAFSAIAFAVVRPWLRRPPRLSTLYIWVIGSQAIGFVILLYAWPPAQGNGSGGSLWESLFYSITASFNAGFTLRPSGLAHQLNVPLVFVSVTSLAIIGSIGWPLILDVVGGLGGLHGPNRAATESPDKPRHARPASRPGGLVELEMVTAFVLLIGAALLLTMFETPGSLPASLVPSRPVDFGDQIVSLRDHMGLRNRWSIAVFVSSALRSAGLQSIPLSPGGVSLPGYCTILAMMVVGGSIAGVAGGMRTTSLMLPIYMLLRRGSSTEFLTIDSSSTRRIARMLLFVPLWLAGNMIAVLLLRALTDGTWYEIGLEATAAWNSVGLSSGLSLHLTGMGRLVMIVFFVVGRLAPIVYWVACILPRVSDSNYSSAR